MSSQFADLFADYAEPLLAEQLGESVTRYPLGVVANAATVDDVIVDRSDESESDDGRRDQKGQKIYRRLLLSVPVDVDVDDRDRWLVDGIIWHTLRDVGVAAGRREILCQRPIPIDTRLPNTRPMPS